MKNNNQGTTIVELTLYMGLLSIFIIIFFDLFTQIISTQTRSTAVSLIQTNGNYLLTKLTRDINQADSIIYPINLGSSASTMTLKIGGTDASYLLSNGRLILTDNTGTYNLNDSNTTITDFSVIKLGNLTGKPGLKLSFTITSNIVDNSNIKSKNFNTFVTIR